MRKFLDSLEENLIVIFMAVVTILTLTGLIFKYIFPDQVEAVNQTAMIAYAWIVFLAIGYSAKKHLFMKLDVISAHYPRSIRLALDLIMNVILFLICIFFLALGAAQLRIMFASGELYKKTAISMGIVYAAPVLGYGLSVFRYLQHAVASMKKKEQGGGNIL